MQLYTKFVGSLTVFYLGVTPLTALKAICSSVLVRRIIAIITSRNVYVYHLRNSHNLFLKESKCKFTPKVLHLMLTCTYTVFYAVPSQHPISGHYRPASEMPFGWPFAGGPIVSRFYGLTGYFLQPT